MPTAATTPKQGRTTRRRRAARAVLLRTVWLFVGAAIGLAAVLLMLSVAAVLSSAVGVSGPILTGVCLLPIVALGLVPGVRELEITAARSLLLITDDLVQPARVSAEHRVRLVLLVTAHLLLGLAAAALLVAGLPGSVLLAAAGGSPTPVDLSGLLLPGWPPAQSIAVGVLGVAGALLGTVGLGRLGGAAARRLLGPTAGDRLGVALNRLAAEAEHIRLARELHDGIGQALTVIGLQAAAGRRLLERDPDRTAIALDTVEATARTALDELDGMLGLLRRDEVDPRREPGLDQLPRLIETFRAAGLDVTYADAREPEGDRGPLPWLVSNTVYRVVAESLTNASRYAAPGPVEVCLDPSEKWLRVEVTSALGRGVRRPRIGGGRGLTGLRERVNLLGGKLHAGPADARWQVRATVPVGGWSGD